MRSLGRAGVKVVTIDPSRVCRASSSRHVEQHFFLGARRLKKPALGPNGSRNSAARAPATPFMRPATRCRSPSLATAMRWAAASEFYQPGLDTIMRILDKGRLLQDARAIGIDTPDTWFPKTGEEAARLAKEAGGYFLIKPRSQLAQRTKSKGAVAEADGSRVRFLFDRYVSDIALESEFAKTNPESLLPLLQRYYPAANNSIYSLSGFREQTCGD